MFCSPSARPDQNGPARSATAVKASPLSATVTVEATTSSATATPQSSRAASPSRSIDTTTATATHRSGRIRLPTLSDSCPAAMRPSAPNTWVTATRVPAAAADHPRSVTSQASE